MVVYGIPVGSDSYVRYMLEKVVEDVGSQVEKVQELLADESQAMWGVLSSSLAHKLDWHLTLYYPRDMLSAATKLDNIFWSVLENLTRLPIPRVHGQHGGGVGQAAGGRACVPRIQT